MLKRILSTLSPAKRRELKRLLQNDCPACRAASYCPCRVAANATATIGESDNFLPRGRCKQRFRLTAEDMSFQPIVRVQIQVGGIAG